MVNFSGSKTLTVVAREHQKDPATIYRWWRKGVRGVKLQTFMKGGHRHTTDDYLAQFFAAITAASSPDGDSVVSASTPARPSVDASAELARRGF